MMVDRVVISGVEIPEKRRYKKTGIPIPSDSNEYFRIYYHVRIKQEREIKKLAERKMMLGWLLNGEKKKGEST